MTPSTPAQAEACETVEQIAERVLPCMYLGDKCNSSRCPCRLRPGFAAALKSERDSRDREIERLREACETLFSAYRARYLTPSTDRMRSNAPLLREMGELKLAVQALTPGEKS